MADAISLEEAERRERQDERFFNGAFSPEDPKPIQLPKVQASELRDQRVPPREFHVADIIPAATVTLLSGDGGTGKSLLALQLSVATVLGRGWLGFDVKPGRVIYLSAEDDLEELHRRLANIAEDLNVRLADMSDLLLVPLAGEDAVLGAPLGKAALIKPTALMGSLEAEIAAFRPGLIVLDTLADLFGGSENDRSQARQFVQLLRGLAIRHRATVLLLSHPSQSGMANRSGTSGTTGWSNSVRSRLYLERVTLKEDTATVEPDPDLRVLTTKKANYGPTGGEVRLRWRQGVFHPEANQHPGMLQRVAREQTADDVFLDLLGRYNFDRRYVSPNHSRSFAPAVFAKDERARGLTSRAFEGAMNRLFEARKITSEVTGPPSKRSTRIILTAG